VIFLLWALCLLSVIVGSLLPASGPIMSQVAQLHVSDKLLHFSAYTLLAFLPALSLQTWRRILFTAAALIFMGLCLEFAQHLIPGRASDMRDELANTLGVITGTLAAVCRKIPCRQTPSDD